MVQRSGQMAFADHPAAWRKRAAMLRLTAEHLAEPADRANRLRLAGVYDQFAKYAEERLRNSRPLPQSSLRTPSQSAADATHRLPEDTARDHDAATELLIRSGLLPPPAQR